MSQPPSGHDWSSAAEPPSSAGRVPPYLSRGGRGAGSVGRGGAGETGTGRAGHFASDPDDLPPEAPAQTPAGLRPFVITSGRVRAGHPDIALETQVTARPEAVDARTAGLSPELRAIVALCRRPVSVAEISARLGLHLGVAKILVDDLHSAEIIDVHQTEKVAQHDTETIARVIRAVSAIS
ncbi:MAG: DUF742 domain-containing protein [Actinobacteria bacterium]|nr:DUF742 domain-containing protein [Actinomycetota bacterium]MBI3688822.1 DUF742 domain-containing protein [Actinomycetota bacterium]